MPTLEQDLVPLPTLDLAAVGMSLAFSAAPTDLPITMTIVITMMTLE